MRLRPLSLDHLSNTEIWRHIPPASLLHDRECRRNVAERLAGIIDQVKFGVPDAAPELDLLARGETRSLLQALAQMPLEPGTWQLPRHDLRMSIVLWALVAGERRYAFPHSGPVAAPILMASGLAQRARRLPLPRKETLQTPRHGRSEDQRREVGAWRTERRRTEQLALAWLSEGIDEAWLKRLDNEVSNAPRAYSSKEEVRDEPAAPEPQVSGPSRVVMSVPLNEEASSREKREEARHWNRLSRPLPLIAGPSPEELRSTLLAEFPWMTAAVERLTAELRLRQRGADGAWFHLRPLLLVGPPSTGKSRFARRLGEIAGVATRVMSVAGSSDARELLGTAKGWGSATPSGAVRLIRESQQANPMMVIDEIDKISESTHNGRITDALLTLTENETAARWYDECLGRSMDLTSVNWLFLANSLAPLPAPLRSRLGIIEVPRPKADHFPLILAGMLADMAAELGIAVDDLPSLHPEATAYLQRQFARGISMRQIRGAVARALAVEMPQAATEN